jgi:hypothetical protein
MLGQEILLVDLRLFDEEPEENQADEPAVIIYGKGESEEPNTGEVGGEEQQLSSDFSYDFSKLSPEGKKSAYEAMKSEFKEDFHRDFQSNLDRRFKENKEVVAKVSQYEPIVNDLMKFYKVKTVEELQSKIEEEVLESLAEDEGFKDVAAYKRSRQALNENAELKEKLNSKTEEERVQATVKGWMDDTSEIKKNYPSFDMDKALENENFRAKIQAGYSFIDAFQVTLEKSFKVAEPEKKVNRPKEQGSKPQGGVVRKTDPSKFSDSDIDDIRKRVARGEVIRL